MYLISTFDSPLLSSWDLIKVALLELSMLLYTKLEPFKALHVMWHPTSSLI